MSDLISFEFLSFFAVCAFIGGILWAAYAIGQGEE